jgi:hypothetical protein
MGAGTPLDPQSDPPSMGEHITPGRPAPAPRRRWRRYRVAWLLIAGGIALSMLSFLAFAFLLGGRSTVTAERAGDTDNSGPFVPVPPGVNNIVPPVPGEGVEQYQWRVHVEEDLSQVSASILQIRSVLAAGQSVDASTQASIVEQLKQAVDLLESATESVQIAFSLSSAETVDASRWREDFDEQQRRVNEILNAVAGSLSPGQTVDTQNQEHATEQLLLAYYSLSQAKTSAQLALTANASAERGQVESSPTAATSSTATESVSSNNTPSSNAAPGTVVVAAIGAVSGFVTAIAGLITALVTWRKARREEPAATQA